MRTIRAMIVQAAVGAFVVPFLLVMKGQADASQTVPQLGSEVEESLRGERDLRSIEVDVQGSKATLTGRVPHLWAKDQAIKRALEVEGIELVVSELELPEAEDDNDIAEDIAEAVQRYPHYTIWDHITGRVNGGKVFLGGCVTPDREKANELFERVAKIMGVQDVENEIRKLPSSRSDRSLRLSIQRQLASNTSFERFVGMSHPPFHIVVNNGIITLVGYVQSQTEVIEMQRIVAQTQGVLRVDNQLEKLQ